MKWALPPWEESSEREPVPIQTPRAMERLPGISSVTTLAPLGRTVLAKLWAGAVTPPGCGLRPAPTYFCPGAAGESLRASFRLSLILPSRSMSRTLTTISSPSATSS